MLVRMLDRMLVFVSDLFFFGDVSFYRQSRRHRRVWSVWVQVERARLGVEIRFVHLGVCRGRSSWLDRKCCCWMTVVLAL